MSLSSHLDRPDSPVRQYMLEHFPNTKVFYPEIRALLQQTKPIEPPPSANRGTLGTAFDYRVRYYFAITSVQRLVAWQGAKIALASPPPEGFALDEELLEAFWKELLAELVMLEPERRRLKAKDEERLNRYCIVLALFEQCFRALPSPRSLLFSKGHRKIGDLLASVDSDMVQDLSAMSSRFFETQEKNLSLPFTLNPTFDGSADVQGADADIVLDHCLLEIKTSLSPKADDFRSSFYQLLGYVLLDYSDQYKISKLGLYFGRHGARTTWPLSHVLQSLAGVQTPPLTELRKEFRRRISG